jgi:hypothetical protein
VGASPYRSIDALRRDFALIDPERFRETIEARGFRLEREERYPLPASKAFWMGIFARIS